MNQTESSKTSDKKKAQHTLRLREGAVARRERIVVEDLTVADAAKLVVSDYQVNERKSLTDALGRIKHVVAFFGGMKLSQDYDSHDQGVYQASTIGGTDREPGADDPEC